MNCKPCLYSSELHAAESVASLNKALLRLKAIWEEVGIPEDQRLLRTNVVQKHVKEMLDMMIEEEEEMKKRVESSLETCRRELDDLCLELQLPTFQVGLGISWPTRSTIQF